MQHIQQNIMEQLEVTKLHGLIEIQVENGWLVHEILHGEVSLTFLHLCIQNH